MKKKEIKKRRLDLYLEENSIRELDEIAKNQGLSRSALIQVLVNKFLKTERRNLQWKTI